MFATIGLVVSFLVVYILNFYWRIAQAQWVSQFPGPSLILPIVGNAWEFAGNPRNFVDFVARNFRKQGLTWKFWILNRPTIITADPKVFKVFLEGNTHLDKHFVYNTALHSMLGKNSLIYSRADQWQRDRKIFNRTFNFAQFESGVKSAVDVWPITRSKIMSSDGKPMDAFDMFKYIVIHYVVESIDVSESALEASSIQLLKNQVDSVFGIARDCLANPLTENWIYWKMFGWERKVKKIRKAVDTIFCENVVNGSATKNAENKLKDSTDALEGKNSHKRMRDVMGDRFFLTKWKISNITSIVGAATETTALTVTMTLFFLALNPDCLKRVEEEVYSAFGSQNELKNVKVTNLKYLKMCIKESMRLHAPIPLFGRKASATVVLDDGRRIPEGADILLEVPQVHLNPEYFPDPLKFDPERFNEVNISNIKPFTYIPFFMGPRNCIGQKFAECTMPLLIAPILKHFSISTLQKAEDIGTFYEIAGVPTPPVQLIFTPRSLDEVENWKD